MSNFTKLKQTITAMLDEREAARNGLPLRKALDAYEVEAKKRLKKGDKKIRDAQKLADAESDKTAAEMDGPDTGDKLVKSIQFSHASGAITGAQASHLDLMRRQNKLPADVRTALLSLDIGGEA